MARSDEVEIGWWPTDRVSDLQSFIGAAWKPGHVLATDEELLRWQHPRGEDELSILGATTAGELVGILGVIPTQMSVHGRRRSGAWLSTWVVVPAARPMGVGLRLLQAVLDEHDVVGTIGGNETTLRILGALGFEVWPSVPRWVKALCPGGVVWVGRSWPATSTSAPATSAVAFRDWDDSLAESWDVVWADTLAPGLVGTWRDARYLRRRYVDHPRFRYRTRLAIDEGSGLPTALTVHRVEEIRGHAVSVVRVVEALGASAPLGALLAGIGDSDPERGAAFADFYCTSTGPAAALERAGFVREECLERPLPSRFQPFEREGSPLAAALRSVGRAHGGVPPTLEGAYLTRSDCDQDRPS